jgi:hypothetical protein
MIIIIGGFWGTVLTIARIVLLIGLVLAIVTYVTQRFVR